MIERAVCLDVFNVLASVPLMNTKDGRSSSQFALEIQGHEKNASNTLSPDGTATGQLNLHGGEPRTKLSAWSDSLTLPTRIMHKCKVDPMMFSY